MLNPSDTQKVRSSLYQARVPKAINRLMQLANIIRSKKVFKPRWLFHEYFISPCKKCKNALFTSSWRIGQLLVTARVSNLPRCHWLININKKTTYVESDSIQRYFQPLECAIAIAVITPTHSAWYANPLPNESAKHPCTLCSFERFLRMTMVLADLSSIHLY